ncbi:RNA-directed RNA polymerase [ssRNA phage Gephyllon.1_8]|uniref:RNA-directed RNA polymerase n=2 Tax=Leviviricetes TaxID=2842243 RepID=A0A8S5L432_9VIRU|nr:RNA-directed RNA polymerase [ssRNA phage Gephyllon.1_8]QDH86484.1 MAG: RNA-dependent RNA polymerase [Leviviridae sp.]DAD52135.1 TPA_asm: RNA-directed RNA polymerase [ssRNA phage Gephyllon.1_8]
MKSLMLFYKEVLTEVGTRCGVSTSQDYKTILARIEEEGFSFLTITLTNFGKDLEKGLDQGYVDHTLFKAFAFQKGLPRLFGGFLDLIFDRKSGVLLDLPSEDSIQAIRQLSLMFGKVRMQCTPERDYAALRRYVECEQEVKDADKTFPLYEEDFKRVSSLLYSGLFTNLDLMAYKGEFLPKHGSGATADRLHGNAKYYQADWPVRLEEYFPAGEMLFPNWRYYDASFINYLEPGSEVPVKVTLVPKTLKTPRVIAEEPTAMQYAQQGVLEAITDEISRDYVLNSLIGNKYQEPNQLLALKGSSDGSLATLDLSEASDRVSNQHVLAILDRHPHFREAVQACRSRKADVPGFGLLRLAKFASMGSALCFPFESIVFLTVVLLGIEKKLNTRLSRNDIKSFVGKVRVYGDDIIVPVEYAQSVADYLEAFGFKVNRSKSFWTGKFRESCGKEYYNGYDVSIVRVRSMFPLSRDDSSELISIVSLRNQLYKAGLWQSVRYLDGLIGDKIPFPAVGPDSPALGKFSFLGYETQRVDPHLQIPLVRAAVTESTFPRNEVDDRFALMKVFLKRGDEPLAKRHLIESGRPNRVRTKIRWVRSY